MSHTTEHGGTHFVDTAFLNSVRNIDLALSHLGFGDFRATGEVDLTFIRVDHWLVVPGFVGRAHRVCGTTQDIVSTLTKMKEAGALEEVAYPS